MLNYFEMSMNSFKLLEFLGSDKSSDIVSQEKGRNDRERKLDNGINGFRRQIETLFDK